LLRDRRPALDVGYAVFQAFDHYLSIYGNGCSVEARGGRNLTSTFDLERDFSFVRTIDWPSYASEMSLEQVPLVRNISRGTRDCPTGYDCDHSGAACHGSSSRNGDETAWPKRRVLGEGIPDDSEQHGGGTKRRKIQVFDPPATTLLAVDTGDHADHAEHETDDEKREEE